MQVHGPASIEYIPLPDDLRAAIRAAVLEMPQRDPAAFQKIYDGKQGPWVPADNAAYDSIVELNRFVDALRRRG